jgi:hypothetical protein
MGKGRRTKLEKFPTSFLAKGDLLGVETNIFTFNMTNGGLMFTTLVLMLQQVANGKGTVYNNISPEK